MNRRAIPAPTIAAWQLSPGRLPAIPRDMRWPYLLTAGGAALTTAGFLASRFTYDGSRLTGVVASIALIQGLGILLRARGAPRAGRAVEQAGLLLATSILGPLASILLAVSAAPFVDDSLHRADALLFFGFDWLALMRVLAPHQLLLYALSLAYSSLRWQPWVLLALLAASGLRREASVFVLAWLVSLGICLAIFPLMPALGGYLHFGITPAAMPGVAVDSAWIHAPVLNGVRDGSLRVVGLDSLTGMITFPSFHAAAAVLLGWGFARCGVLAAPLVALNVAMFVSAVPIGGHYLVDILAGGLLAAAAIAIAGRMVSASDG